MKFSIFQHKGNIKGIIFISGIVLIIAGIWYSQQLVHDLKEQSTEYIRFRIKVFETNINNPKSDVNIDFLFNDVIQTADYPIIYTDINYQPQSWRNISEELDQKTLQNLDKSDSTRLFEALETMATENAPIPIEYQGAPLGYYFYGYPPVIYKLRSFPYIASGAVVVFILMGYLGFSYIKRSEQRFIWVGMAKETAHQLGTPLSSLSGWLELLKNNPALLSDAIVEMANDLTRLNKVAARFSKIGSVPELKQQSVNKIIHNVIQYFQRRIPNLDQRVTINFSSRKDINAKINEELFEWVIENLIKNALDATKDRKSLIEIHLEHDVNHNEVLIDISDNGLGITPHNKKNVFKPGYSTKKRGWGLGLSLANRIIEEYHNGKLMLKESKLNQGSTFRIILKNG